MSQIPHKSLQKMCKSPKNSSYSTIKQEKIDYENLSTNCTVVGSNNLNLVKKPQIVTSMSPAYSNSSPGYPPSPYSSPASMKSPSPSLKPPTPQPNFPVMQIIHNNLLARPIQTSQPQNIIKLKPHLNILPKPSASPQSSPKPSVSPQIVIPTNHQPTAAAAATIMPTAQPLLLNQMPMLTAPAGVQFILRPQTTTKIQPQVQATPQGLILQSPGGGQQLLQIHQPQAAARSQPMVRVLTNGMHLAPTSTTTYVTQVGQQPINATHIAQQQTIVNNTHQQQVIQQQVKKKPKHKVKKKLDLANIMKLSGIGDEDDIQFESDTSQSESEPTSVPTTPQPQVVQSSTVQAQSNYVHTDAKKNIQNIQISAVAQPTINTATPVVQVLNQNFQSGMISNSTSQAATAQASIPFNSFITPNFTINNGLMLQRSGGFKLTVGDDGRLVLQHDPTLNQDLQSQLILQGLLGLNGGLVLHPSMDQQTVQQTVQTIQQQSVQTIQQQTVQSQTIQTVQQQTVQPQTVQHTIQSLQPQIQQQTVQQTIQHQTVNALQQPMQIVQPQPIASIHSQAQPMHTISQSQVHSLQSQIQSLLQQQNQAVQAQAVQHSHVQPQSIHPQTLQNVQNLQNIQNLQQNVQGMQQNVQQNIPQNVQQNVQNLQQNVQHVHPQSIQSPVHSVQNFSTQTHSQTQPVLKVQPFQKSQPPVQTVQPIQHHSVNHQQQQPQEQQTQQQPHENPQNQSQNNPTPPASYVVNLTPDQLEQLKRNGQLTVNGQTIFMQRPNKDQSDKKMSPKSKPIKKVNKIQGIKGILQENAVNDSVKPSNNTEQVKESIAKPLVSALNAPSKHILPQNYVQPQPIQNKPVQQQAMVQPQPLGPQVHAKTSERPKAVALSPQLSKQQKVSPTLSSIQSQDSNGSNTNPDVDKLLGQILEESGGGLANSNRNAVTSTAPSQQRITTIQLTPQKQQHLKSIQLQIQTLSARLTPGDTEMQHALKMLFSEQQKILASGKLLPPDKVYYHNNQLTIVNPSSLNLSPPIPTVKNEPPLSPDVNQAVGCQNVSKNSSMKTESLSSHQPTSTQVPHAITRLSISTPASENTVTQTVHHHPPPIPNSHTHCHLPQHSAIIHRHSPIPNQVPGHLVSNHQISCHPTSTIHHQPHSAQVGPVSHSAPATHSTQVGHSTQINQTIQVGHAAQVGHATQIGHVTQVGGSTAQITHASQINHSAQGCHPGQLNHSTQVGHVAQVTQTASICHSTQVCHVAQSSHATQPCHTPQVGHTVSQGSHPVQIGNQSHLSPGSISVHSKIGPAQQLSPVSVINIQQQNLQHTSQLSQQLQQHGLQPSQHIPQHQQQQVQHQHLQQQELIVQQQQQKQQEQQQFLSLAKKSHLIETQLNLDQNGAIKPDIHTPFRDKKDACIKLVRYHCLEQPVLSQKDLDKADEIFELTARHFMGKYSKMVDKYKYLLMKESMRQVQTSELMMLDRLFLAEEQQSLIRLRQDYENQLLNIPMPNPEHQQGSCSKQNSQLQQQVHQPSTSQNSSSQIVVPAGKCTDSPPEDYDEWACIQRELGCLPQSDASATNSIKQSQGSTSSQQVSLNAVNTQHMHNSKRSASSDSRLETLKRFRVEKHHKKSMDYHVSCNSGGVQNNSAISSVPSTVSNNQSSKSSNSYEITQNSNYSSHEENEPENNSIDEQVQSAIDSILNLQQNTNTPLDLDSILS